MKTIKRIAAMTAALVLLFVCGAQAAAADAAGQTVNVLVLASETMGDSFFPIVPMIVSLDLAKGTVRVVYFYFEAQIFAETQKYGALSIPMSLLSHCEIPEIVRAYENTFGITIDRHLIYRYEYGSYEPAAEMYDLFCPITLDIPEEILGTAKYTTLNGNMKALSKSMKRDYTPVEQAGPQALDTVGFLAYFSSIPDRVWESGDRFTMAMEDYKYWDMKNRAVIEALGPVLEAADPSLVQAFLQLAIRDQITDITVEDIAAWSSAPFRFSADTSYFTVPGFEGVELKDGDAGALPGVDSYQAAMLAYDTETIAASLRAFLNGE
jgi:hypothetical protein